MASVTGLTAERTLEIEKAAVVSMRLEVSGDEIILIAVTKGNGDIRLGNVRGAQGGGSPFVVLTSAQYAALATKGPNTLYVQKN